MLGLRTKTRRLADQLAILCAGWPYYDESVATFLKDKPADIRASFEIALLIVDSYLVGNTLCQFIQDPDRCQVLFRKYERSIYEILQYGDDFASEMNRGMRKMIRVKDVVRRRDEQQYLGACLAGSLPGGTDLLELKTSHWTLFEGLHEYRCKRYQSALSIGSKPDPYFSLAREFYKDYTGDESDDPKYDVIQISLILSKVVNSLSWLCSQSLS